MSDNNLPDDEFQNKYAKDVCNCCHGADCPTHDKVPTCSGLPTFLSLPDSGLLVISGDPRFSSPSPENSSTPLSPSKPEIQSWPLSAPSFVSLPRGTGGPGAKHHTMLPGDGVFKVDAKIDRDADGRIWLTVPGLTCFNLTALCGKTGGTHFLEKWAAQFFNKEPTDEAGI